MGKDNENLSRRAMLTTAGAVAAMALGADAISAEEPKPKDKDTLGTRCLLTLQFTGLDAETFSTEAKAKVFLEKFVPIIAEEMVRAKGQPKTRGCAVSGTVTGGPGGVSGSGTITCTF